MRQALSLALLLPLLAGGCLAKTAIGVVTAPVRVASKATDWATTSQEEADRNYGRKMRKQEAAEGKARREAAKRCRNQPGTCQGYDGYRAGY